MELKVIQTQVQTQDQTSRNEAQEGRTSLVCTARMDLRGKTSMPSNAAIQPRISSGISLGVGRKALQSGGAHAVALSGDMRVQVGIQHP